MAMSDDLKAIEAQVAEGVAKVTSMEELEKLRVSVTGKKGQLTAIMRMMGKIPPEERPAMGQLANTVRANVEAQIKQRQLELGKERLAKKMAAEAADVTLPGRCLSLGTYIVADGPYVETTWYNFTALNAPADHPSRSARDSFYVVDNAPEGKEPLILGDSDVLLRTQTSGMQVHYMEQNKPPIYMICPGTVFRPDTADANHLPQFNQVEGLVVDEGITFGDLKGTLDYFCHEIFGKDRATRYRPHFFPFTEPSCEVTPTCWRTAASTPRSTPASPSALAWSASRHCATTCPTCACSWKATCASCVSSRQEQSRFLRAERHNKCAFHMSG